MRSIEQVFFIFLFYAFGELLSVLIARFIPGSVLGMLFLFIALRLKIVKPQQVEGVSSFLTTNMGVFFVPAGVGLITQLDLLRQYWLAITLSMVLSTILVLAVVAWAQQKMEAHSLKHKKRL
ncbi:CidA/LrgA family protein [Porphyromonas circumdentaria]|uniref:Holin-like protein n=1 Tax=Porphyromonas circumdentaria TaxID=29524 RepID=A0A1T4MF50_9PORP|nr:CidA/LrgA family protein [Porphyromonas circumdentaria]MBB6275783.1 holin-like protein [Porphyromonas circumdentaria]SJZ65543.1 holin-like protein [Porphyromonas circumdentaria]